LNRSVSTEELGVEPDPRMCEHKPVYGLAELPAVEDDLAVALADRSVRAVGSAIVPAELPFAGRAELVPLPPM